MCVDYAEFEIAQWLLAHGADVNAKAAVDADGFGGHTALFGCVVTSAMLTKDARFAGLLLEQGRRLEDPGLTAKAVAVHRRPDTARVSQRDTTRVGGTVSR